ncbi:hypothetical protein [Psychromonas sp.]|uniref:hypothetical protein n=1 Tax=Psychromonas sp. TaxID=1884585 RepID=UPI0039E68F18
MKKIMVTILTLMLSLGLSSVEAKSDKEKTVPPGLQKKVARGGQLPPGWQKKLNVGETLEAEIYHSAHIVVPVDLQGIITVQIEDRVVRLIEASREIIEILN